MVRIVATEDAGVTVFFISISFIRGDFSTRLLGSVFIKGVEISGTVSGREISVVIRGAEISVVATGGEVSVGITGG